MYPLSGGSTVVHLLSRANSYSLLSSERPLWVQCGLLQRRSIPLHYAQQFKKKYLPQSCKTLTFVSPYSHVVVITASQNSSLRTQHHLNAHYGKGQTISITESSNTVLCKNHSQFCEVLLHTHYKTTHRFSWQWTALTQSMCSISWEREGGGLCSTHSTCRTCSVERWCRETCSDRLPLSS